MNIVSTTAKVIEPDGDYDEVDAISARILHILSIYPQVSPSMLQIALGTPAGSWKPVLEHLIASGIVKRSHTMSPTPSGRHQTYTILSVNS